MTRTWVVALVLASAVTGSLAFGQDEAMSVPTITASCSPGPQNCSGWQTTNGSLSWNVSVSVPPLTFLNCPSHPFEPDGIHTAKCVATDGGGTANSEQTLRIDKTAPTVTGAVPMTPPSATGWYTAPLEIVFAGTDATSGIPAQGCVRATYAGPDAQTVSVSGTCRDVAGNVSAPFTFTFKYDGTPPTLGPPRVEPGDGMVRLRWSARDAVSVEVTRSPGLSGAPLSAVFRGTASAFVDRRVRNLSAYQYQVTAVDRAGNVATRTVRASPARRLLAPRNGARLKSPPVARWSEISRATYYNVQLYRGDRKILSLWPRSAQLKLRRTWTFQGVRHRLAPGAYRLFVWPGFGSFAQQKYGRIVGKGRFVVTT